ncbi:MAG: hypothetical protein JXA24_00860 [Proteobacteria bacterium]|nr:hypothetical protein [Pseudomonadota bacterium]
MVTKVINVHSDGVNEQEWKRIEEELRAGNKVQLVNDDGALLRDLKSADLSSITKDALNQQFSQSGDAASPSQNKMDELVAKIEELKQQNATQEQIQAKQAELANIIKQAEAGNSNLNLASYKDAAGMGEKSPLMGEGKAQAAINQQAGAQGDKTTYSAKSQQGTGFTPPASWGAQTMGGVPKFNTATYMQTMSLEDNVMSAWDSINKNTSRGKQLMQLFFYFARMAESGDMGAMYQFMKFITYIVSKDKAKQQIEMGKKLIQLQELSRQWTNKLLNVSGDSSDPNASSELMKTMTIVKSETDAIATSQKLISQMMEEFAQVVETLTNTTKSALDTAGRIMRTVSTMR